MNDNLGSVTALCVGTAAMTLGAPPPGAIEAAVAAGGLIGFVLGKRDKFGLECDRVRGRIQKKVLADYRQFLTGTDANAVAADELMRVDAVLREALPSCVIDKRELARFATSAEGLPSSFTRAVLEDLGKFDPETFGKHAADGLAYRFARDVVAAGIEAAVQDPQFYRSLEGELMSEMGRKLGTIHDELRAFGQQQARQTQMLQQFEERQSEQIALLKRAIEASNSRPVMPIAAVSPGTGQAPAGEPIGEGPRLSLAQVADDFLRLSISGREGEAAVLAIVSLAQLAEQDGEDRREPLSLAPTLRLVRRLSALLWGKWVGGDPELAAARLADLRALVAARNEDGIDRRTFLLTIDMLDIRLSRRRSLELASALRDRDLYVRRLSEACEALASAIAADEAIDQELRNEITFALAQSHFDLSVECKILRRVATASGWLEQTIAGLRGLQQSTGSFGREVRLLTARCYLHSPEGAILDAERVRQSRRVLNDRIETRLKDIDWLELWVRATIRLALKIKTDEVLDQGISWQSLINQATSLVLEATELERSDPRYLRLLLRLERKNREVELSVHDLSPRVTELTAGSLAYLTTASLPTFLGILREIESRPVQTDADAGLLIALRNEIGASLSPARRFLMLEVLLGSLERYSGPHADALAGLKGDVLTDLATAEVTYTGRLDARRTLRRVLQRRAAMLMESVMAGERDIEDYVAAANRLFGFLAQGDRKHVVGFSRRQIEHARECLRREQFQAARRLTVLAAQKAWRYGPNDLATFRDAIDLLPEALRGEPPSFQEAALLDLRQAADAMHVESLGETGTLLFTARQLISSPRVKDRERGDRLTYEALAARDSLDYADNRTASRTLFAERLLNRLFSFNQEVARRKDAPPPDYPSRTAIEHFVESDGSSLATDLTHLLGAVRMRKPPPGTILACRLVGVTREGARSGAHFRHADNDEDIFVDKELLGRRLRSQLSRAIPEWSSVRGLFERDPAETDELPLGDVFVLNMRNPSEHGLEATMVGPEFISKALRLLWPGMLVHPRLLTIGGSNSWAVVRTSSDAVTSALRGGLSKQVEMFLGLNRLTLCPAYPNDMVTEIRHFVNNTWRDLRIHDLTSSRIVLRFNDDGPNPDNTKARTFRSIFEKTYPDLELDFPRFDYAAESEDERNEAW